MPTLCCKLCCKKSAGRNRRHPMIPAYVAPAATGQRQGSIKHHLGGDHAGDDAFPLFLALREGPG
jgi:hypothetical protein